MWPQRYTKIKTGLIRVQDDYLGPGYADYIGQFKDPLFPDVTSPDHDRKSRDNTWVKGGGGADRLPLLQWQSCLESFQAGFAIEVWRPPRAKLIIANTFIRRFEHVQNVVPSERQPLCSAQTATAIR